ncbi:uncharacterized protein LOC144283277 isoform X4 [Canis aureus]
MALRWKYLIKSDYKALGKMKCQLHKWQAIIKVISGSGKQGYLLSQLQDNGSHWNKRPSLCQLFLAHVLWNLKTCIPRDADICNMPLLFPLLGSAVDQLWATGRRQASCCHMSTFLRAARNPIPLPGWTSSRRQACCGLWTASSPSCVCSL